MTDIKTQATGINPNIQARDKLEELASSSDTIEEVHENKEQIEISKFYEKLPNPVLIAVDEYINGSIEFQYKSENEEEK